MTALIRTSNAPTNRGAGGYTLGAAATLVNPYFQDFDRRFSNVLTTDKTRLFFPLVVAPPPPFDPSLADWTAVEDGQIFTGLWYSNQTLEEALGATPIIPGLAYDDDPSRNFDVSQQQDDDPWHTFFTIPTPPPTLGWDDYDWNKNFTVSWTAQDAEVLDFFVPPTPLAWDDFDWNKSFQQASQIATEEQAGLLPIVPAPAPNLGWDDWDWSHAAGAFTMADMYTSDEYGGVPIIPSPTTQNFMATGIQNFLSQDISEGVKFAP